LALRESTTPIHRFVDDGNPAHISLYRSLRQTAELGFADIREALQADHETLALIDRARDGWTAAARIGTVVMSTSGRSGATHDQMDAYEAQVSAAVDTLSAAVERIHERVDSDFADAQHTFTQTEWLAGIAAGVSLLLVISSVLIIGRMILTNVDRLVEGAARFAEGDRDHRIDIQVPPELHRVADEFNYMIGRIRQAEQALAEQARRDVLTGLLNRRSFDEALSEAQARVKRLDERFALVMADLDHFKKVNDTYGHACGDAVLKDVSKRMTMALRDVDKAFRIGGEEFAILLPGLDADGAAVAAERLRSVIAAEPIRADGVEMPVTASFGVALSSPSLDSKSLMDRADQALYRAKTEGRNRVIASE